ncbi:MAG: 2-oxo acid dehydrogenase subunit E2 [Proteobacteria bacterium]|nr:2-oxo acid dehydrogenase subunit E2 [Pseudomonadota bacterium]
MAAPIFAVTMPKWGIEMQEGLVTDWHAAVGERIAKDAPLLDVETDKIVNAVESPVEGTLRRILAERGQAYPVGALLAVYADPAVSEAEVDAFVAGFRPVDASFEPADATVTGAPAAPIAAAAPAPVAEAGEGGQRVSPIARRLAEKLGIDVTQIHGTGPNGRVSKEDVETFAARQGAKPAATAATSANASRRERLSPMRQTIARRLLESKQTIPHYRLEATVDGAALQARRAALAAAGTSASLNDFIVRATALALVEVPALNAHLEGEDVVTFADADVAVAVATEQGLLTPIVRAANRLGLAQIGAATRDLAARARAGRLTREEITGGTFTVSNLGMHGLERFDAIINPPQVAILAVGALRPAVLVRQGQAVVGERLTLTLSCDHRVVDGAVGARFLKRLVELLEAPDTL